MKIRKFIILLSAILTISVNVLNSQDTDPVGNSPVNFNELHSRQLYSSPYINWQQFGPGTSGYCEVVEYHPTDPECVMMSPDMFNTYASYNNGYTWQSVKDHDGNGGDLLRVRDYSFSKKNPEFGMGLDFKAALYITHDKGSNWVRSGFDQTLCSVIEISPHNDSIVFIGGGDNFVKRNKRTYKNPHHTGINADCGKLWRSSDRGETWEMMNKGIHPEAGFMKIRFHPEKEGVVYAATSHGLYKTIDHGNNWKNIGSGLSHNMIRDMELYVDQQSGKLNIVVIDQVYWLPDGNGSIQSEGGVYKTENEGDNWECLNGNLYLDVSGMSKPVREHFYHAFRRWYGISMAQAKRDFPVLPDSALHNFNRLVIHPTNPDIMYLGHSARHDISFYAGDLWKTEDGGDTWIMSTRIGYAWEDDDRDFWLERGNPVNQNMQFAHLHHEVSQYNYPMTGCRALTINTKGDVMAVFEQQTFMSKDNGETWKQIDDIETSPGSGEWVGTGNSNLPGRPVYMDPRLDGKYYLLSGEHGLWQLVDHDAGILDGVPSVRQLTGQNEAQGPYTFFDGYHGTHSPAALAIHPKDKNILYMLMFRQDHAGHVRKSEDAGRTWQNIAHPLEMKKYGNRNRVHQYSLIINNKNPDRMYFCVPTWTINDIGSNRGGEPGGKYGVYASVDGGYSWKVKNEGLPGDHAVNFLTFDPFNNNILYAAVLESYDKSTKGGLYISKDHAESWKALPIPSNIRSVNHVHINPVTGFIYIACGLYGGDLEDGGVWLSRDKGHTWEQIFEMPLAYKVTSSPKEPDRIGIAIGLSTHVNQQVNAYHAASHYGYLKHDVDYLNPGFYLSLDQGRSWYKGNQGLGQPDRITDLKFDLEDPNKIWCALSGSGWYKGTIEMKFLGEDIDKQPPK